MKHWKDNVFFVLVEPREPGNIGASARAMKNMGFTNLEIIRPRQFKTEEARSMACNATDVLEVATVCPDLAQSLREKKLVVGTTRRLGKRRGVILPLKEGIRKIASVAKCNKVAILFGREDKGLNNKEVEECGFLITIPADPSSPSLNLAQSVLLVAYELSSKIYKIEMPELVVQEQLWQLYAHIESALRLLEYVPRGDRDLEKRIMRNVKHLIGRAGLTEWELKMLRGICTQVEKRMRNGR